MEKQKRAEIRIRERKLKAKYRKKIAIAVVVSLIVGFLAGFFLARSSAPDTAAPDAAPTALAFVTEAPQADTAEGTEFSFGSEGTFGTDGFPGADTGTGTDANAGAAATSGDAAAAGVDTAPTATPEPRVVIVPFGATQPVSLELYSSDGSVRKAADDQAYEKVNFDISVSRYLTNDYYQSTFTDYQLQGTETGVEFELLMKDYMGSQKIDLNSLNFSLESADGTTDTGYKLTDAAIGGSSSFEFTTNVPVKLYKRFKYSPSVGDMKYLVVTTFNNGVANIYKFELGEPVRPTPEPTKMLTAMTVGAFGDDVVKLQKKLIELGYLEEGSADGDFGSKTAEAVKKAQAAYGMPETGVADHALQVKLYGEG